MGQVPVLRGTTGVRHTRGDTYNQRFGRALDCVENKTRCMDDVPMWDKEVEQHWWRLIWYLDLKAKNGIVL